MLPTAEHFATSMAALGVSHSKPVIVYDALGMFSAPRVWWTLRVFGHSHAAVLRGGLPAWVLESGPTESGPAAAHAVPAAPLETWALNVPAVRTLAQVADSVTRAQARGRTPDAATDLIVDARPEGRFTGAAPEPRPGIPSGHMPSARSVPFSAVLDPARPGDFLPRASLLKVFAAAGVDVSRTPGAIVTSCGTGVTAAVVYMALALAGRPLAGLALYDGSWTEWASTPGTPRATGPADA
jgi:thiosulfate/3-mercaptopyruvate sulfurtransferase